jgi:hypothetical protein
VTGVQTCALPIFLPDAREGLAEDEDEKEGRRNDKHEDPRIFKKEPDLMPYDNRKLHNSPPT